MPLRVEMNLIVIIVTKTMKIPLLSYDEQYVIVCCCSLLYWTDWSARNEAINRGPISGDQIYTPIVRSTYLQRPMRPDALAIDFAGK